MTAQKGALLLSILIVVGMAACGSGSSTVKIGWVETSLPGKLEASFQLFTGSETRTVRLEEGEELTLIMQATLEEGELRLELQDPQENTIFKTDLDQPGTRSAAYMAERGGRYRLTVIGQEAKGSFEILWEVE
jgi:hypothetical protein